jgi:hypothetical protein
MLRKFVCAAVIMVIGLGVAVADEFVGVITKVDGNKVTFRKGFKKDDQGEAMTLPVTASAKITKGTNFNKDTKKFDSDEPIKDGLKAEQFTKIGEKGVFARITTDDANKNITAIQLFAGFGKKKKAD